MTFSLRNFFHTEVEMTMAVKVLLFPGRSILCTYVPEGDVSGRKTFTIYLAGAFQELFISSCPSEFQSGPIFLLPAELPFPLQHFL